MTEAQVAWLLAHIEPTDRLALSFEPLREIWLTPPPRVSPHIKPQGLWYSCGDAWLSWIMGSIANHYKRYQHAYLLKLRTYRMRMIHTLEDFADFEETYGNIESGSIRWPEVYEDYAGVEICPYQGSRRWAHSSMWYYSWDVASGCVWNPAAVEDVIPIKLPRAK